MVLREFQFNDTDSLYFLLQQVWFLDNKNIFPDNIKNLLSKGSKIFIVEINNKVVGSATLNFQTKLIRNGGIAGFIEEVVVDEKYRGKKIGEKLIKYISKKALDMGCYKVVLSCFKERIPFYERCGFIKESYTMRKNN